VAGQCDLIANPGAVAVTKPAVDLHLDLDRDHGGISMRALRTASPRKRPPKLAALESLSATEARELLVHRL
jgi:hypothetical protein